MTSCLRRRRPALSGKHLCAAAGQLRIQRDPSADPGFTDLFARGIGEGTDVVDKEMYTFLDRNEESLTLRPEGTAGCVRAVLEHGMTGGGQVQKLWYTGPMFRYEKPQKGRYRQFHQIGVEVFNQPGPDIDAELIVLTARLWKQLGLADAVTLQLNSRAPARLGRATAMLWWPTCSSVSSSSTRTVSVA